MPFAESPLGWAGALVVPCILVGLPLAALLLRLTRTAVSGVLGEDYIVTASAKGLDERTVLRRHVVRAAAAPVISATGVTVNLTITNVVLIETVFGIPGVFGQMRDAIDHGDFPMLMGITIVGATVIALGTCSPTSRSRGSTPASGASGDDVAGNRGASRAMRPSRP